MKFFKLLLAGFLLSKCGLASFLDCEISIAHSGFSTVLARDVVDLEKGFQQINIVTFVHGQETGSICTSLTFEQIQFIRECGINRLMVETILLNNNRHVSLSVGHQKKAVSLKGAGPYCLSMPIVHQSKNVSINMRCERVESNPETDPSYIFQIEESYGQQNWQARSYWEPYYSPKSTFTDPKKYDPSHFQFIVYGLTNCLKLGETNFINQPELIKNALISASLVNEYHIAANHGSCGYILTVPSENIFLAKPGWQILDTVTIKRGLKYAIRELKKQNAYHGPLVSPKEVILNRENRHSANEIGLLGTTIKKGLRFEVAIGGVFFIKGEHCGYGIEDELREYANKNGLPVVDLPSPKSAKEIELPPPRSAWEKFIESFYERFDDAF